MDFVGQQREREHIDQLRRKFETIGSKSPQDQEILLEFEEEPENGLKLATLTIKSGAKNALSGKMISQLTERLDEVDRWLSLTAGQDEEDGRAAGPCLLVKGFGSTFCSGSDLIGAKESANHADGLALAQVMQFNMMRIQRLPIISVCHVEGFALGGGAELALASDFRLMSEEAKLGFVHSRVGVCAGWGGGSRLVELAGRSRALELLASGRLIKSDEAVRLGLAEQVANDRRQVMAFIRSHSIKSQRTSGALKSMVNAARCLPLADALLVEAHLFASTWGRPAHLRALAQNIKHDGRRPH